MTGPTDWNSQDCCSVYLEDDEKMERKPTALIIPASLGEPVILGRPRPDNAMPGRVCLRDWCIRWGSNPRPED